MKKERRSKFADRIFLTKDGLMHLTWDHRVDGVDHWWYSDYQEKFGYLKGKPEVPKGWVEVGWLPEGSVVAARERLPE